MIIGSDSICPTVSIESSSVTIQLNINISVIDCQLLLKGLSSGVFEQLTPCSTPVITHGGMNCLSEAFYYGVPLLSVPQSADQP